MDVVALGCAGVMLSVDLLVLEGAEAVFIVEPLPLMLLLLLLLLLFPPTLTAVVVIALILLLEMVLREWGVVEGGWLMASLSSDGACGPSSAAL